MLGLKMLKEVGKTLKIECTGHVYDYDNYIDGYEFKISQGNKVIEYIYIDNYVFEPVKVKNAQDICEDCFSVLKRSVIDIIATECEEYLWIHFDEYKSDDCDKIFENVEVYNAYINIISNCLKSIKNK